MEFEAVIGLEVHCQLSTDSKIFCSCPAKMPVAEMAPNTHTCPVCAGHPGTLPVLNKKVVEFAIRAGLATNCTINHENIFSRKNYFYPDLPKGYQISQYDRPICSHGALEITTQAGTRKIPIERIHMEEDAGKNVHTRDYSLVNLNRAGVPLCEIVSGPDMKTSEEAGAYLRALHAVVTYIGICDGNMQEGNFRCDANVSVMPKGSKTFGTRAEIKNVNSFRFVEKAIDYEIARQIEVIKAGGKIILETRTYDSDKNITISMRSKEEAHDYRYFPDPDLIPVKIEQAWIDQIKVAMPELPAQIKTRYVKELGLSAYDAGVLTSSRGLARFFDETMQEATRSGVGAQAAAKGASNLLTGSVARLINEAGKEITESPFTPKHISDILKLTSENIISSTGATTVINCIWQTGEPVSKIVEDKGLKQVSDVSALEPAIDKIIATYPGQAAEVRAGKEKLIGFFVGQVMKETGGKANPGMLQEMIKKKLST